LRFEQSKFGTMEFTTNSLEILIRVKFLGGSYASLEVKVSYLRVECTNRNPQERSVEVALKYHRGCILDTPRPFEACCFFWLPY